MGLFGHIQARRVVARVSAPDADSTPQPAAEKLSATEVRKRNEDALSRVLGDFAVAKATGKLDEVDEDEEEIEGVEGEDWVWWRAENVESTSSSKPVTPATSASASSAAAGSAAASSSTPAAPAAPSAAQGPPKPALKRPARAPLLKVPQQPLGQPTSKFARKAPGSSSSGTPPPPTSQ